MYIESKRDLKDADSIKLLVYHKYGLEYHDEEIPENNDSSYHQIWMSPMRPNVNYLYEGKVTIYYFDDTISFNKLFYSI